MIALPLVCPRCLVAIVQELLQPPIITLTHQTNTAVILTAHLASVILLHLSVSPILPSQTSEKLTLPRSYSSNDRIKTGRFFFLQLDTAM